MKTSLISLAFTISTIPFAFWKLEGPFGIRREDILSDETSSQIPNEFIPPSKEWSEIQGDYEYTFLYNKQTGYTISCQHENILAPKVFDLFQIKKTLTELQRPFFYDFYFTQGKQNLNLNENPLIPDKIIEYSRRLGDFSVTYRKKKNSVPSFSEQKTKEDDLLKKLNIKQIRIKSQVGIIPRIETSSGVTIHNQNGKVKISNKGQPVDFQEKLIKYFDTHTRFTNLATELKYSKTAKTLEKFRAVPDINKEAFQRLNDSVILEVYSVLENDKGQNAIIWGSAKEKSGEQKNFHWITDLEADISELFKL